MRQQVNLYQPIFRKQEKKFSAVAMLQAVGIVLVGIVLLFAWTQWQVSLLRGELVRTEQQLASAAKRLEDVERQFGGQAARGVSIDEEIARLEQQLEAKQRVQGVLGRGLFSNTTGFSDYFTAFARQRQPGVWLTAFSIVGAADQMTLRGRASSDEAVPRYIQRLSAEQRLAGIEFRTFQLERDQGAGVMTFTLQTAAVAGEGKR